MFTRSGDNTLADGGSVGRDWREDCLNLTRVMAIATAALVPASTAAASICIALMLLAWLVSGRALATLRMAAVQRAGQAMLLFMALLVVDMLYSSGTWVERWGSLWSWRKLLWGFIVLGLFAEDMWKFRFVCAFLIVSTIGLIASFLGGVGLIPPKTVYTVGVYLTNHATQGITFVLATLCCLEMARIVRPEISKWCYLGAFAFSMNVMFLSTSRSAYLALLCVMLVWSVRAHGQRSIALATTGAVALALFSLSPNLKDRVAQGVHEVNTYETTPEVTSAGVRVMFLKNTLELFKIRPLLGSGTGSFAKEYRDHFGSPQKGWRGVAATDPHNQYLFILIENGLLGLAVFLMLLAAGFQAAREPGAYRGIIFGALLAWCASSLFNSHFRTFPEGHLIWLFFGAMLSVNHLSSSDSADSKP
jgi:O-antigen ligase